MDGGRAGQPFQRRRRPRGWVLLLLPPQGVPTRGSIKAPSAHHFRVPLAIPPIYNVITVALSQTLAPRRAGALPRRTRRPPSGPYRRHPLQRQQIVHGTVSGGDKREQHRQNRDRCQPSTAGRFPCSTVFGNAVGRCGVHRVLRSQ